ncbi:MAG: phage scaffolding protein [Clostridium sp.]
MKLEEILKAQGLSEEQIAGILKGMKDNKVYTTSEENIDDRYSKLKGQKDNLDEQLKTANETIGDLKKSNKGNEELQTKVTEYETKVTEYETKISDMRFNYAVDEVLKGSNVKNIKAIKALLNLEQVKIEGESTVGLKEQVEELKKSDSYLFETSITGLEPGDGNSTPIDKGATDLRSALAQRYDANN